MESIFAQFLNLPLGQVDHHIDTDSSSASPTCDEEGSWESETRGWDVAMDSEQKKGLQDGTSANK